MMDLKSFQLKKKEKKFWIHLKSKVTTIHTNFGWNSNEDSKNYVRILILREILEEILAFNQHSYLRPFGLSNQSGSSVRSTTLFFKKKKTRPYTTNYGELTSDAFTISLSSLYLIIIFATMLGTHHRWLIE